MEGEKEAENTHRTKMFVSVICKITNFDKCREGKVWVLLLSSCQHRDSDRKARVPHHQAARPSWKVSCGSGLRPGAEGHLGSAAPMSTL